jgi:choline-sulfatase
LSVELLKPHFPQYVTPDLWDEYAAGADLPRYGRDEPSANHPRARDLRDHFQTDKFTDDQIRGLRRGYLGCISFVDQQLGRLIDALERTKQLANTIVIYTSDHGDMLGKFGMWWKSSLYDDSSRVPLIVAGPGFAPGARVKTPVSLFDLQASFFHALDAKRPAHWSGTPLQKVAANDPSRVVFSEYHGHGTRASSFLVRRGDTKLMYHVDAPSQLFNLADDPEELHNLADSKPALLKDLTQELRKFCDPELENRRAEEMIGKELAALEKFPKNAASDG